MTHFTLAPLHKLRLSAGSATVMRTITGELFSRTRSIAT